MGIAAEQFSLISPRLPNCYERKFLRILRGESVVSASDRQRVEQVGRTLKLCKNWQSVDAVKTCLLYELDDMLEHVTPADLTLSELGILISLLGGVRARLEPLPGLRVVK
jgi:hypothetical protein